MAPDTLDPSDVLGSVGTDDPMDFVSTGLDAARAGDYERGLILLAEACLRLNRDSDGKIPPAALSSYGLCVAMHRGRFKEAADYCQLAITKEFYDPEHYLNLARVWVAGKSRRKAVEAIDRGLAVEPANLTLRKLRAGLGVRRAPVVGFLHRDHPLNQALGRLRHRLRGPTGQRKKK